MDLMQTNLFRKILPPPIFKDDYGGIVAKFLNGILVTLISLLSILLTYRLVTRGWPPDTTEQTLLGVIIIDFILLVTLRHGYVQVSSISLVISGWVAISYQVWRVDGIYDAAIIGYVVIIVMASVLTNWQVEAFVAGISILAVWGLALYHPNAVTQTVGAARNYARDLTLFFSLAGVITFFLVRTINEATKRIRKELDDRILIEQTLRQQQKVLEEQKVELEEKNAELTQFAYTVSHDLKSPLVTINGYLGYLEQDAASGNIERLKKDTQRIQEATNKMHTLLTELLELSRIGRMMNMSVDVSFEDLVKDALDLVHGQIQSQSVAIHIQLNLPIVHGDRQRLTEVLQNLLDNAAKYMGDQPDPLIEIGQHGEEDGNLIFFVRDNGIGIASQYHERIFGLFNKLDAESEGTGIGLALVKRIVEFHGGRIWVESDFGQGSTFYFTLPSVSDKTNNKD
jgi:signal transduction histidine kinase